ncbi:hypothetical protein JXQ31_15035 [candidate division KSB1 bacterium]|nr:hypothetical protein [candidate division KSB1 bacterium]
MHFYKIGIKFCLIILPVLFLVFGCEKNPTDTMPETTAPTLPPAGSMTLDVSMFNSNTGSLAKAASPESKSNFNNAVIRVALINTAVLTGMAVPTAVFVAAITEKPTLEPDGKFHWVYVVQYGTMTFKAELTGWVDITDNKIKWEMFITNNAYKPALENFKWYEGWSNLENDKGQWVIYNPQKPAAPEKVIQLDWQYNNENDRNLIFTNVSGNENGNGDILKYTVLNTDCKIEFFDKSENFNSIIFWDSVTTAGYLQVPNYNNGQPAYWDENHDDIAPPV